MLRQPGIPVGTVGHACPTSENQARVHRSSQIFSNGQTDPTHAASNQVHTPFPKTGWYGYVVLTLELLEAG
jgi:hypothetical protein